ncbi:hypothetical protein O3G_MSEX004762 [Manduca sexta]|uniref:Phosphatidylinositol N-acetylglucosaminyltransferase subunit Q n=1 Tax=Manduca sexta TaxID=7130 RepID=A0A922CHL4_MANSE|nr:hypothetical protein O3G_MSEX004762 [Manduca sexta]
MALISNSIKILFPIVPKECQEFYFKGVVNNSEHAITVFITKYSTSTNLLFDLNEKTKNSICGYCSSNVSNKLMHMSNLLVLDQCYPHRINKLVINGKRINTNNLVFMLYDYDVMKKSQIKLDDSDFLDLQILIQNENGRTNETSPYISNLTTPYWLTSSMFLQHILNYLNLARWLVITIRRDKKVSIKQGNLILAIIMDIILGYVALQLLSQDKRDINSALMGVLEKLINSLYSLLRWLMGAPVGLKLNNAFNNMLGRYFSYHVQLWWLFLDVSGEKLDTIIHVYRYMGYLGITFQTAVISDLICIATFHSYCIYVYAARLFNMQISGLIALMRLFVGRKYNPLRGGIDSCEYTNQELFVGTVAFTILLLLLPTTALYYIVFTMFRVLSLMVQHVLAKLIYVVQTLPIYVTSLWVMQSPKIAGNILIEILHKEEASLILKIKLFSISLGSLITSYKPPVEVPTRVEWANLISNVLVGKQII